MRMRKGKGAVSALSPSLPLSATHSTSLPRNDIHATLRHSAPLPSFLPSGQLQRANDGREGEGGGERISLLHERERAAADTAGDIGELGKRHIV